ncbi:MAG TPA: 50S ribosomal protein L11 methyltransferase [Saprospiraceae bacterium]|nr:50S ribosomal protein L11 methyltransferase [Saprospiraceae bacterium]
MYYAVDFVASEENTELLNALFLDDFEAVEFTDNGFAGYLTKGVKADALLPKLKELESALDFSFTVRAIEEENWNAQWEAGFQPVEIGDFCRIYADFHEEKEGFVHQILINPKMAFGTGHHETTHMMIRAMEQIPITGKIWDFGTGTGILAILARKMGAPAGIIANDIEEAAVENSRENMVINGVNGIDFRLGGIEIVQESGFDLVLANINRNVILSSLEPLVKRLKPGGQVLFSGIMKQDYQMVADRCQALGLDEQMYLELNNWVCTLFLRKKS